MTPVGVGSLCRLMIVCGELCAAVVIASVPTGLVVSGAYLAATARLKCGRARAAGAFDGSWQNKYMVNLFRIGNEVFNAAQIAFVNLDYHGRGLKDAVCIYFAFQADDASADQSA